MEKKIYCIECKWIGKMINYYWETPSCREDYEKAKENRWCDCPNQNRYIKHITSFEEKLLESPPTINDCNKNNDCKFFESKNTEFK